VINRGPDADARAVIKEIQEGIMFLVAGEPAVRGGVELPESADFQADFQALPAAGRGGRARRGGGMSQLVSDSPAAHGGLQARRGTALDFFPRLRLFLVARWPR
jgi:hypothetical protein